MTTSLAALREEWEKTRLEQISYGAASIVERLFARAEAAERERDEARRMLLPLVPERKYDDPLHDKIMGCLCPSCQSDRGWISQHNIQREQKALQARVAALEAGLSEFRDAMMPWYSFNSPAFQRARALLTEEK